MPNLAGVFRLRETTDPLDPILSKMTEVLSVRGVEFRCARWADQRFGAVNLLKPEVDDVAQPALLPGGGQVLFLDGEIYNATALCAAAAPPLQPRGGGVASRSLALYACDPTETARQLNGSFNLAYYDRERQLLQLVSDRLGSRPLYYQLDRGVLYFASEQKAILAARGAEPRFDDLGLFLFASFGHQLDDRTVLDGISVLPPGAILTASEQGGVQITRYWRPTYRAVSRSGRDAATELSERLVAATGRRLAERRAPVGIFLSGGLDSRCVAGALAATGAERSVTAFTFGGERSLDVQFARQLASKLHFSHQVFDYGGLDFTETLPRAVWRTEAALPFSDCLSIELHRHIAPAARLIFNGHLGDALSGGHLLPELFWLRRRELTAHILRKRSLISKDRLRALCAPRQFESLYDRMTEVIERSLDTFEEERPALLYNLWDLEVRQRRYTQSTPSVDRYVLEQLSPFLDNDVVEFFLSLPASELFGQRCYLRSILEAFPVFAQVPWARTGRAIERSHALRMARLGGKSVLGKAQRLLPRGRRAAPSPIGGLSSPGLHEEARAYLSSEKFPDHILDRGAVGQVVEQHFGGGPSHLEEVGVLLTLSSASHLFSGSPHVPDEVQPRLSLN